MAQWLAQVPYKHKVGGSNPSSPTNRFGRAPQGALFFGDAMAVTLSSLANLLEQEGLLVTTRSLTDETDAPVCGTDCDSRFSRAGHLFICKGKAFKEQYLLSALEKGSVGYLCDESLAEKLAAAVPGVPALVVNDVRRTMGVVSPVAWGHPDRDLDVIGLTGTKGKSTTAYMLRAILDNGVTGSGTGIMGSIDMYDGIESFESVNTTPEAPDLWRHVANTKEAGLRRLVMEVSSHGLKYDRTLGLELDVACFLNLGRDHISPIEHPDFEDYFQSKLKIFSQARVAVVNKGTDRLDEVLAAAQVCERLLVFSDRGPADGVDVWATDITPHDGLVTFTAHTPSWGTEVTIPFPGLFNVENALCAISVCEVLGVGPEQVAAGIAHTRVPGRMEVIPTRGGNVTAIVDYAHNKLSYQRFFSSMKEEFPGYEIIAVFGCPGDKALERRFELPQEAAKWSDLLIYTEEDPAHETVADICAEMAANTPEGAHYEVILDREEAIAYSVKHAFTCGRKALVCLLAKGDETRQHEGDFFVPSRTDGEIFEEAVAQFEPEA